MGIVITYAAHDATVSKMRGGDSIGLDCSTDHRMACATAASIKNIQRGQIVRGRNAGHQSTIDGYEIGADGARK